MFESDEEARKAIAEAVGYYLFITIDHPGTAQAKIASDRLGAIGFWEDEKGNLRVDKDHRRRPSRSAEPASKAAGPKQSRATTLLRTGRNLEKPGKLDAAMKYYRQTVQEYPGSPEASEAAKILKDVGEASGLTNRTTAEVASVSRSNRPSLRKEMMQQVASQSDIRAATYPRA
jgi:hypothetical protein